MTSHEVDSTYVTNRLNIESVTIIICGCLFVDAVDPCMLLPDGDYPLDKRFHRLLPGVNSRCNFVKCAHRSAFVNPCSRGTRNPDHDLGLHAADPRTTGAHYCSVRDVTNYCQNQYYHRSHDGDDVKNTDYDEYELHTNVKHYYVA